MDVLVHRLSESSRACWVKIRSDYLFWTSWLLTLPLELRLGCQTAPPSCSGLQNTGWAVMFPRSWDMSSEEWQIWRIRTCFAKSGPDFTYKHFFFFLAESFISFIWSYQVVSVNQWCHPLMSSAWFQGCCVTRVVEGDDFYDLCKNWLMFF